MFEMGYGVGIEFLIREEIGDPQRTTLHCITLLLARQSDHDMEFV